MALKEPETIDTATEGIAQENTSNQSPKNENTLVATRLLKLQELKKKKQESEKLNKQELFDDHKKQKLKSLAYKNIEKNKMNAELEQERLDSIEKGEDFDRKQNWSWTIEDCEKWENKKKRDNKNLRSGFQNFSGMAQQSYNKELQNLEVDKDEYERQKKALLQKHGVEDPRELKKVIDLSNKPKSADKNRLVRNIEDANNRRMKRRRNKDEEDDVNSYINDKNKQFNLKLNRQYNE